jgi:hypothetical protein
VKHLQAHGQHAAGIFENLDRMVQMAASPRRVEAPIPIRQCARMIDSVHTEVMTHGYSDRTLVLITQTGKIGSLVGSNLL